MDAATAEQAKAWAGSWERYIEATYARICAERAAKAALAAGDSTGCAVAAFDLETALLAESNARTELAGVFLFALQAAIDAQPNELFGKVMAFAMAQEMKEIVAWLTSTKQGRFAHVAELEGRLHRAEAEVKTLRGECWELARWIRELETKNTAGGAHGDQGPGQRDEQRGADVRPDHERQAG